MDSAPKSRATGCRHGREHGFSLLESMMAILIVSFGVLGILRLQTAAIAASNSARLRTEASLLSNEMLGLLWSDRANVGLYRLNDADTRCAEGPNAAPANAPDALGSWIGKVEGRLPQAKELRQTVAVDGASGLVTVRLCWREPQDASPHAHEAFARIR